MRVKILLIYYLSLLTALVSLNFMYNFFINSCKVIINIPFYKNNKRFRSRRKSILQIIFASSYVASFFFIFPQTVRADDRSSYSIGGFDIKARRIIKNTSFNNGGIQINLEDGEVVKKDGSFKLVADSAVILIKIKSILKFELDFKIIKLKNATVDIIRPKNNKAIKKNNDIKLFSKIPKFLHGIEEYALIFQTIDINNSEFNNILIKIHEHDEIEGNVIKITNTKINSHYKNPIMHILSKDNNEVDISTEISINNIIYRAKLLCKHKLNGQACTVMVKNVNAKLLNPVLYRNNLQILDFKDLMLNVKAEFGSYFNHNNISFTAYIKDDSKIKMWTEGIIEPKSTVSHLILNPDNRTLEMSPTILDLGKFGVGEFGFKLSFLENKNTEKHFTWKLDNIYNDELNEVLDLLTGVNRKMKDVIKGIEQNVSISGDVLKITKGSIKDRKNKGLDIDIRIETKSTDYIVKPLNNMLLRDVKSSISISMDKVKVLLKNFKIGNQEMEDGVVNIVDLSKKNKLPRIDVSLKGSSSLLNALENPSMPSYVNTIKDILKANPESTINGTINSSFFIDNDIDLQKSFSYRSNFEIKDIKSDILKGKGGISIKAEKDFKDKHLYIDCLFDKDSKVKLGDNIVIKKPQDRFKLTFKFEDIFLKTGAQDYRLIGGAKNRIDNPNNIQKKDIASSSLLRISDIKMIDLSNNYLLSDLDIDFISDDLFIKSIFYADIRRFELLNSNFNGHIRKNVGRNYQFNISGTSLDFYNLTGIYKYISEGSDSNTFNDTRIDGYMVIDKVSLFNDISLIDLHFKSIIKNGFFKDVEIGGDFIRRESIAKRVINNIKNNFNKEHFSGALEGNKSKTNKEKADKKIKKIEEICPIKDKGKNDKYSIFLKILKNPHNNEISLKVEDMSIFLEGLNIGEGFRDKIDYASLSVDAKQIDHGVGKVEYFNVENSIRGIASIEEKFCYIGTKDNGEMNPLRIDKFISKFNFNINEKTLLLRDTVIKTNLVKIKSLGYLNFKDNTVLINGKIYLLGSNQKKNLLDTDIPIIGDAIRESLKTSTRDLILTFSINGPIDKMSDHVIIRPSKYILFLGGLGGLGVFGILLGTLIALL